MTKIIFRPQPKPSAQPSPQPSWPPMNVPYTDQQGLLLIDNSDSQLRITLELLEGFEIPEFTRAGIAQYENWEQFGFIECEAVVRGGTYLDLTFADFDSYLAGCNYCSEIGNMVFGLADGTYVNTGFILS